MLSASVERTQPGNEPGEWLWRLDSTWQLRSTRGGLAATSDGGAFVGWHADDGITGNSRAIVARLGPGGAARWMRTWHSGRGYFGEQPIALLTLPDGGLLVGGQYSREDCPVAGGDRGCTDAFLTRFDAEGEERWTLVFGNRAELDRIMSLALGEKGLVFAGGHFNGDIDLPGDEALVSNGGIDYFVMAVDVEACEVRWARNYGTRVDDLEGPALAPMPDGGVGVVFPKGLRRLAANGDEQWVAMESIPFTYIAASDSRGHLWAVTLGPQVMKAETTLLEVDGDGLEFARRTYASPTGGIYRITGIFPEGKVLGVLGNYGIEPLSTRTTSLTQELLWHGENGTTARLAKFPLWSMGLTPAVRSSGGALIFAGAYEQSSDFGLGIEPVQAQGSDAFTVRLCYPTLVSGGCD